MRPARFLIVTLTVALAVVSTPSSAPAGEEAAWPSLSDTPRKQGGGEGDTAVVVGVADYDELPDVEGADQNARDWERYFLYSRGLRPSRITVLLDRDAKDHRIRAAVEQAVEDVAPGGTVWFVFIGHGAPTPDRDEGVLVTYDAGRDGIYDRSIPQGWLLDTLGKARDATAVMVVDACFSGQGTSSGQLLAPTLQPLIPGSELEVSQPNVVVLTAGEANQFAGPLPGVSRPAFSYLMLGALRGWADQSEWTGNQDKEVTVGEAVAYTQEVLKAVVKDRRQVPQMAGSLRDHVLARKAAEPGPDVLQIRSALRAPSTPVPVITPVAEVATPRPQPGLHPYPTEVTVEIEVTSDPEGAVVFVNGREAGRTPYMDFVSSGDAELELRSPFYLPTQKRVRFLPPAGGGRQRMHFKLEPNFATVEITGPAEGEVHIDGSMVGTLSGGPWLSGPLAAGSHTVEVQLPGHRPARQRVELRVGERKALRLMPQTQTGSLQVLAQKPRGASAVVAVYLDGERVGETPLRLAEVSVGSHEVEIQDEAGEFDTVTKTVTIRDRKTEKLVVKLKETPIVRPTVTSPTPVAVAAPTPTTRPTGRGGTAGMVTVPAGSFQMGFGDRVMTSFVPICQQVNPQCTRAYFEDAPWKELTLSEFQIDTTEVTVSDFVGFLNARRSHQGCEGQLCASTTAEKPGAVVVKVGRQYQPVAGREQMPMTNVSWYGAKAYCEWAGKRLPTEAEWEKAARGTDGRHFPWGFEWADCSRALFANDEGGKAASCVGQARPGAMRDGTGPVGLYPQDRSPYGVLDMMGNVQEWVADWYEAGYYGAAPTRDPQGPATGSSKVRRGASWGHDAVYGLTSFRDSTKPETMGDLIGFRCAR